MEQMVTKLQINVVNMHTGGEPLRLVTSGFPEVAGDTLLEKLNYVKQNYDHLRKMIMHEPRGHKDQYGALLVSPDLPGAESAVLFMHNAGYGNMCGHGIIALGRYLVDQKLKLGNSDITANSVVPVKIQCLAGLIEVEVEMDEGVPGAVSFTSIPSFLVKRDCKAELPKYGTVTFDVSYGGRFFGLIDVTQIGLDFSSASCTELIDFAETITNYMKENIPVSHPEDENLPCLYAAVLTDDTDAHKKIFKNLAIFGDSQIDRSPTGSAVAARLAALYTKTLVKQEESVVFENGKIGSRFRAQICEETTCGVLKAVRVKVTGRAYYTGHSTYFQEETDPFKDGFLIR